MGPAAWKETSREIADRLPADEAWPEIEGQIDGLIGFYADGGSAGREPDFYRLCEEFPVYLLQFDDVSTSKSRGRELVDLVKPTGRVHLQIKDQFEQARWFARVAPRDMFPGQDQFKDLSWVVCEFGKSRQAELIDEAVKKIDKIPGMQVDFARLVTVPAVNLDALWFGYEGDDSEDEQVYMLSPVDKRTTDRPLQLLPPARFLDAVRERRPPRGYVRTPDAGSQ